MEEVLCDLLGAAMWAALQGYYHPVVDASAPLVRCNFLVPDGRRAFWVGYRCVVRPDGNFLHWYVNGLSVPTAWVPALIQAVHGAWEAGLLS